LDPAPDGYEAEFAFDEVPAYIAGLDYVVTETLDAYRKVAHSEDALNESKTQRFYGKGAAMAKWLQSYATALAATEKETVEIHLENLQEGGNRIQPSLSWKNEHVYDVLSPSGDDMGRISYTYRPEKRDLEVTVTTFGNNPTGDIFGRQSVNTTFWFS